MDLNRLRMLLAAPITCLFLILILCVFAAQPVSTGIAIPVMRLRSTRMLSCGGNRRDIFIRLRADGKTKINQSEIDPKDLRSRVSTIMDTRAVRVVFLVPESGISYDRFVQSLDELNKAATEMHIAVLSGSLRDEYFQRGLQPCDIEWPGY
jgi:biopolymer transport protein ExbD